MRRENKHLAVRLTALLLSLAFASVLLLQLNRSSAARAQTGTLIGDPFGPRVSNAVNIYKQPESQTVVVGDTATFTVWANVPGTTINYQWEYRRNSSSAWAPSGQPGNQTDTLKVSTSAGLHGYQFRCVIDDGGITPAKTSNIVTLYLRPRITTWPKDTSATVDSTAQFTMAATGKGPLKYQWQYRKDASSEWKPSGQSGNQTPTLSVKAGTGLHGYQFRCCVTDANGQKSYTNTVTLTVKPKITTWPKDASVEVGSTAKFTMAASGKAPLKYQWQYRSSSSGEWKPSGQSGNKTATLSVAATTGLNGYQFRCYVTDANGQKSYTNTVTLTVKASITKQPEDKTVSVGNTAAFSVTASGKATLKYQWQYRSNPADSWKNSGQSGNKTAKLSVATKVSMQGYQFRCVVTDGNGNKTYSNSATLFLVNVPINATTFPDAKFRDYVSRQYDRDHNGSLSAEEINAVLRMNVENDNYTSLKGVEFFTELTDLSCGGNSPLSTLNVSANRRLKDLSCEECGLTSLNLSGCERLVTLRCFENKLTTLDLSSNWLLETVDCSYNRLTKLDVSNLTTLFELSCFENNITVLDLTEIEEIEYIVCDEGVRIIGASEWVDIVH